MCKKIELMIAAAFLILAMPSVASVFLNQSPQDVMRQSQSVIEGTVLDTTSEWDGDIIKTYATVQVDETLVGRSTGTITVTTIGGTVGDYTMEAEGLPTLEPGERAILFLQSEPSDRSTRITGYQLGIYDVVTGPDGVTKAVPKVDATFLNADGTPAQKPSPTEINAFKTQIKDTALQIGRHDVN